MAAQIVAYGAGAEPLQPAAGVFTQDLPRGTVIYENTGRSGKSGIPHKICAGGDRKDAVYNHIAVADNRAGIGGLRGAEYGEAFYFCIRVEGGAASAENGKVALGAELRSEER